MRPLTSYTKVQLAIGGLIRGNKLFMKDHASRKYLDVGCGANTSDEFVNLDYLWNPNLDVCWDIVKKNYPFPDNRFEGIYTEHCLEHIPFTACENNIKEFYRMLKPGGTVRIVVPDGEIYMDAYRKIKEGAENAVMPYYTPESDYISAMDRVNGIFRKYGHQFIYDFATMKVLLERNGFKDIKKETFMSGRNPALLKDSDHRKVESLYVEATK